MKRSRRKSHRDPVISLINIVFLILIFFMVAGTLSVPPDPSVKFVQTEDLDCCVPPDAIVIDSAGQLLVNGAAVSDVSGIGNSQAKSPSPVRLLPDRDLPAIRLLELVKEIRANGASQIIIVTEDTTP